MDKMRACLIPFLVIFLGACSQNASSVEPLFQTVETSEGSEAYQLGRTLAYGALRQEGPAVALP